MIEFKVQEPRIVAGRPMGRALSRWLERHRPELRDYHEDADHFGNVVMVLAKYGLDVRFVIDRDDLLVDVGRGGDWVAVQNIDAFLRGVPVREGHSWPAFDPLVAPEAVLGALDAPDLRVFLRGADADALAAMGFAVAQG